MADPLFEMNVMVRASIYLRIDYDRHRRLSEYAKQSGMTVNDTCLRLIDQLLAQVSPGFSWPDWMIEAVAAGHLPFQIPEHVDEGDPLEDDEGMPAADEVLRAC